MKCRKLKLYNLKCSYSDLELIHCLLYNSLKELSAILSNNPEDESANICFCEVSNLLSKVEDIIYKE